MTAYVVWSTGRDADELTLQGVRTTREAGEAYTRRSPQALDARLQRWRVACAHHEARSDDLGVEELLRLPRGGRQRGLDYQFRTA